MKKETTYGNLTKNRDKDITEIRDYLMKYVS